MPPVLLLHGPTASGKTALALALAARLGGEIVNADALQVYADLRVLTARPTPAEVAQAPHHLFGHVDASVRYSVGRWLADAEAVLAGIAARGRAAIVVGGTGLYLRALTRGLAPTPPIDPAIRAGLEAALAAEGPQALHARLAETDPAAAARLAPADGVRIVRALEVALSTGRPLASFQGAERPPLAPGAWRGAALTPPRAALYAAINARFEAMLEAGALAEAAALLARGLDPALPAMKAHGLPWLAAHLRGEMSLTDAADRARQDTRRYAKRQLTWIAGQTPDWPRLTVEGLDARVALLLRLCGELE